MVLLAEGRKPSPVLEEIRRTAAGSGVPVQVVPAAEVDRLAPDQNTQGVAARITEHRFRDLRKLLALVQNRSTQPFILALDQIQDPHNVGALIRTADAAGVEGIVMPERRSAPISGVVARASAGAVSHLPIVEVKNLARALRELKEAGMWVVGLDESTPQTIYDTDFRVPMVLVLGSEGEGLRRLTRETCDFLVRIPMFGSIESLNVSVAGSLAMYEVVRQRRFSVEAGPS